MADTEDVAAAVDRLVGRLEDDDEAAFAEVGGVVRERSDVVVTDEGVRNATTIPSRLVWCRVFADGAAGYACATDLGEGLDDAADRAIRSGKYLAQSEPARVDTEARHRGFHPGWADDRERLDAVPVEGKRDALVDALAAADVDGGGDGDGDAKAGIERARLEYADEHVALSVATTTGSTVHTTTERAAVETVLDPADGPKVRRHDATGEGTALLDELDDRIAAAAADAREGIAAGPGDAPTGGATVALSPRAAGQLVHHVAGYFAADVAMFGFSPYEPGDAVGPDGLRIDDTVAPGSWAAMAYDAEARPTTPVRLVAGGRLRRRLHNTATAADADAFPAGNAVPALGFETAPRIHHRHLDVAPGDADRDDLLAGADLYVRRFGRRWFRNEFERTQREGTMPPSALYARDIAEKTGDTSDAGRFQLSVAEGFRVADGDLGAAVRPRLEVDPGTLRTVDAIGRDRETTTGIAVKHKSHLPYAVTAPGMRLTADLSAR